MNWEQVLEVAKWMPVIRQVEVTLGIPKDLLCRMAFQESSFRPEVIDGTEASPPGALGILQLMPQYFEEVRVAKPFTDEDTKNQILRAGGYLVHLHAQFKDWAEALAAYNYGPGNEEAYLEHRLIDLPKETRNYINAILGDVHV
jgi:soluble lytic murein transglycosylase-like protein